MGSIVFRQIWWVILFVVCMGIILFIGFRLQAGISFILGAFISIIPSVLFARQFFKTMGICVAKKIVTAFYIGEVIKILTTVVLFILVFQWQELEPLVLFLGFITAQLGCLLAFL